MVTNIYFKYRDLSVYDLIELRKFYGRKGVVFAHWDKYIMGIVSDSRVLYDMHRTRLHSIIKKMYF